MSRESAMLPGEPPMTDTTASQSELPTLDEDHAFLLGTGPIDGKWFGDDDSGRPYWWRKFLREAISRPTHDSGMVEQVARALFKFRAGSLDGWQPGDSYYHGIAIAALEAAGIEELRKENERMREALEDIRDLDDAGDPEIRMRAIARAALSRE